LSSIVLLHSGLWAHSSGALWISESKTVVIADIHLGYSWAQRRRGELGPLADERSREKLLRLTNELRPRRFVFLGDLVHAPRPCGPERKWIEDILGELGRSAELIAVRGNHDRAFADEFGYLPVENTLSWSEASLTAIHGDQLAGPTPGQGTLILGHLHPALPVLDASGAGRKLPAFLVSRSCIVLPAFSPFAGGYNVACGLPGELSPLFRGEEIDAFVVTGRRVVALGPLRRVLEKMFSADTSSPKRFRRAKASQADTSLR
jgi:putative SbcD/Mre11-related phosphoesterase